MDLKFIPQFRYAALAGTLGRGVACATVLTGVVTSGLLFGHSVGAAAQTVGNSDPTLSQYTSIVETFRGATVDTVTSEPVASGQDIEQEVTDSDGSYYLQVQPIVLNGQVLNGDTQLQAFDLQTYSLTSWVVGSDGYLSSPIQEQPAAIAPIDSTTPVSTTPVAPGDSIDSTKAASRAVPPRAKLAVNFKRRHHVTYRLEDSIGGTHCDIYGYAPKSEESEFGWLIDGDSEISCSLDYPGSQAIVLDSGLYEFDDWTWLYLNDTENETSVDAGPWYAFFVDDFEPCYDYGETSWEFNTQAYGNVEFGSTIYYGTTAGMYDSVSCSPLF
jgi:hypothetical protein